MATKNAIFCENPTEIECGGTGKQSFTTYAIITGGTTSTGALQSIASVGTSGQVLTSNGAGALPTFQANSDTTNITPTVTATAPTVEGEIFYDTATDTFVGYGLNAGTWTAENAMNTARRLLGGAGTSSLALSFGGFVAAVSAVTESWNGTSWSAENALNTARSGLGGCGSSSDALSFGGNGSQTTTERWDGSNWTAKTGLNTGLADPGSAGNASDALAFGNVSGPSAHTERYDGGGDSWTNKSNMNTARGALGGADDAATALSFGGLAASVSAVTERYDGVGDSWTAKSSMNTARGYLKGSASGSSSNALSFGGGTGGGAATPSAVTELYDTPGDSWTTRTSMNTARFGIGGSGDNSTALAFGGSTGSNSAVTESFGATVAEVTFTTT